MEKDMKIEIDFQIKCPFCMSKDHLEHPRWKMLKDGSFELMVHCSKCPGDITWTYHKDKVEWNRRNK
jgi:hypothetical protein